METTYVWVDPKGMKAYKTMPSDDRKALEKKGWVLTSLSDAFNFLGEDLGWGKSKNFGDKSLEFLKKMAIRSGYEDNSSTREISSPSELTVAPDDYNIVNSDSVFNTVGPDNPAYDQYFHPKSKIDSSKTSKPSANASKPAASSTVNKGSKKDSSNIWGIDTNRALKAAGVSAGALATLATIIGAAYAAKRGKFAPAIRLVKRAAPSTQTAIRSARTKAANGIDKVVDTATGWWNGAKKWFTSKTTRASLPTPASAPPTPAPPTPTPASAPKLGDLSGVSNGKLDNFLKQKFKNAGIDINNWKPWNKMLKDLKNDKTALLDETLTDLKSTYGFKRGGILVKRK